MKRGDLSVRLYPADVTSSTLEADLTDMVAGLRFTTQLHGGYGQCSFVLNTGYATAWGWYDRFARWKRLVVQDAAWKAAGVEKLVWEGRIEDTELILGGVRVTAFGYWASCYHIPHMDYAGASPAAFTYNANEHADDIIADVLTQSCPKISATTHLSDPGLIIATAADPLAWEDEYPGDIITEIAKIGASDKRWWFAVWEGREPWFVSETISAVTWNVRLEDFAPGGLSLRKSPTDYASEVYAVYLAGGVVTRTATASDATIAAENVRKVHVVGNMGEIDSAVATERRDTELAWRKYIQPASRFTLRGAVYDANYLRCPLWRVRAGDVIRIADLVPESTTAVSLDKLRTFYILRTDYDADRNTLTLEPDVNTANLATQLVKGGIGI